MTIHTLILGQRAADALTLHKQGGAPSILSDSAIFIALRTGPSALRSVSRRVQALLHAWPVGGDAMKIAESLRIEGAPALFVEGERISGAPAQDQVWMVIDRALRAAGVEPPAVAARLLNLHRP